jgi:hypothetical protein
MGGSQSVRSQSPGGPTPMTTYTIKTESRLINVQDADVAESYSKAGHKVTARNERGTYLGGSDA